MYKTVLVDTDIEDGRRVVAELEKQLRVTAAFWFHEEEDEWKLVVVSPEVSEKGTTSLYRTIAVLLNDLSIDPQRPVQFPLDRIALLSQHSLTYQMVKQRTGPIGGPVLEGPALDAYIYKLE